MPSQSLRRRTSSKNRILLFMMQEHVTRQVLPFGNLLTKCRPQALGNTFNSMVSLLSAARDLINLIIFPRRLPARRRAPPNGQRHCTIGCCTGTCGGPTLWSAPESSGSRARIPHVRGRRARVSTQLSTTLYPHNTNTSKFPDLSRFASNARSVSDTLRSPEMHAVKQPVDLSDWFMIASAGSFHRVHIDAAGLGTSVHMTKGTKVWFIATTRYDGSTIKPETMASDFNELSALDLAKAFSWEAVLLRQGSRL
jgi:hypothetical protein